MRNRNIALALCFFAILSPSLAQRYTNQYVVRFDTPCSLSGKSVWTKSKSPTTSSGKPITAGSGQNDDREWENASLPLGNGSLGANVMGSINTERITLNEKSLWRGGPNAAKTPSSYWNVNKESAPLLKYIRKAFDQGDYDIAAQLTRENFNGYISYEANGETPFRFGSFTTMGELLIETGIDESKISNYRRELDLQTAVAQVQFNVDKAHYTREFFISYPDKVMAIRFKSSKGAKQNLRLKYTPSPVSRITCQQDGTNGISYCGHLDDNDMEYRVRIKAFSKRKGSISISEDAINVSNAEDVVFLLCASTDYELNLHPDLNDPKTYQKGDAAARVNKAMQAAEVQSYKSLLKRHISDYSSLFRRVSLSLNHSQQRDMPTPNRLKAYRNGEKDYGLEALYFQFGRYLLIASSRPGDLPANLQGIWHNNVDGPWRVDYHNNINLQMNYWPAFTTNLAECNTPLDEFIASLVEPGRNTARNYFGARGWAVSISANPFGMTAPLRDRDMSYNYNPMAGPWLATHLWEAYDFTRDTLYLKKYWPILKESAQFVCDFLYKRKDGYYAAVPSTSPEHGPIDEGATFNHAVARELLTDAIHAAEVVKESTDESSKWQNVLDSIAPYRIGRFGQLMEWSRDIDDPKDQHRHVNHLFGLHPGHSISPITTPQLAQASRVTLEHRGDGATGWSMGWKLNQWARLGDGNHAYKLFGNLLKNGTNDNLWDTHPPFQIDGNFGGTAGIAEMLLQSQGEILNLLPALPNAWKEGKVSGLMGRGAFEVDIQWTDGKLKETRILSKAGADCHVYYQGHELSFSTKKGRSYRIKLSNGNLKLL